MPGNVTIEGQSVITEQMCSSVVTVRPPLQEEARYVRSILRRARATDALRRHGNVAVSCKSTADATTITIEGLHDNCRNRSGKLHPGHVARLGASIVASALRHYQYKVID